MPKARRAADCCSFLDLPNVGKATAADFALLGFSHPHELVGQDPYALFHKLCRLTDSKQDPCVIDVFLAAVRFMEGSKPLQWWHYTPERKKHLADKTRLAVSN